MIRLTIVIPHQQIAPTAIGLPPVLINWITLLLSPMAAIATMIKNLDNSLSGANTLESTPTFTQIVVKIAAKIK